MNLIVKKRYCSKCRLVKDLWQKTEKPYVKKVTGGTHYFCVECELKQKIK